MRLESRRVHSGVSSPHFAPVQSAITRFGSCAPAFMVSRHANPGFRPDRPELPVRRVPLAHCHPDDGEFMRSSDTFNLFQATLAPLVKFVCSRPTRVVPMGHGDAISPASSSDCGSVCRQSASSASMGATMVASRVLLGLIALCCVVGAADADDSMGHSKQGSALDVRLRQKPWHLQIDSEGRLHWKRTGGDPFTDMDFLLHSLNRMNGKFELGQSVR